MPATVIRPEVSGWVVLGLISAVCAALVAILGKIGLQSVDPVAATTARALVMAAVTSVVALASGSAGELRSLDARGWFFVAAAGIAGAASWLAYFAALRLGSAGAVSSLDRLSIVLVVILSAAFLGESLTVPKIVGAVLMVAGAILIAR
jgi:transporter family protein